jgi:hypothetical protein
MEPMLKARIPGIRRGAAKAPQGASGVRRVREAGEAEEWKDEVSDLYREMN